MEVKQLKKINIKKILLLILLVITFFVAIGVVKRYITPITYSNLTTQDSLDEVISVLQDYSISEENINIFIKQVEFTNDYLKDLPGLKGEFTTKKGTVVKYDEELAWNLFIKVVLPEDLNCRVAAWNLVKSKIKSTPIDEDIEYAEQSILDYYPYTGFQKNDKQLFWSVFKGIPTKGINTTKGYSKIIQEEWKKRQVEFESNDVFLISCFSYAFDNKWLEAVHTGVMINVPDGVLFIEKFNPKAPFQVSKFKNENQLKYYLKQRLLNAFVLQPIIMKNDELL